MDANAEPTAAPHALHGQTVLVLGLGASGLAMAEWCARQGANVRVADSRESPPMAAALAETLPATVLQRGFDPGLLDGVQRVLKSPGLSPLEPQLAALLARAREQGVPVSGELALFTEALAQLKAERGYAPKLVAVTGTNGKTTVTMLAALLIERSGLRTAVAGNVGPSLLATLTEALRNEDAAPPADAPHAAGLRADVPSANAPHVDAPAGRGAAGLPEAWVLELSSFQLDGASNFEPDAAVVLNLSQDHLDWHGSMAAYAEAKSRIYGQRATMVINRDDAMVQAMLPPPAAAAKTGAMRGRRAPAAPPRKAVRFGLDAPRAPGDYGLVVEHGMAWLVRALEADETAKQRRGAVHENAELHLQRLMPADALRIRGRHNAANALAALALAVAIGRPLAPMLHALREYRGEPHRVELLAVVRGIEAYDDSKGTNVGATVAALDGLGAEKAPGKLTVILGGDGKGQDFAPLAAPLLRHARAVALIGRDAGAIEAALAATPVPLSHHATLQAATRWAFEQARPGDALLLSPACASLDMFRNYKHRAEVFAATVAELAHEAGELS